METAKCQHVLSVTVKGKGAVGKGHVYTPQKEEQIKVKYLSYN